MATAPHALAERLLTRADIEVKRLEAQQAAQEQIFEWHRTRLHEINAELYRWRTERTRWEEARDRAALSRIGRAS